MAKLAQIKTKENNASVKDFLDSVTPDQKRKDAYAVMKIMEKAFGEKPKLWGTALIGFGKKVYKSPTSGREVEWFIIGFSPRKSNISIHFPGDVKKYDALLGKLGKHKTGMGCVYINQLGDIDSKVLEKLIETFLKDAKQKSK